MRKSIPALTYQDATLTAVPSMHFNSLFADLVNDLCRDPATRPSAVAVELGPECARQVDNWLKELDVYAGAPLPVMLGLQKENRTIPASKLDRAIGLIRTTGVPLSEMRPEILFEELDYCQSEVLYLSPSDSIVEGIRCAGELKIPLFGVDLDEVDLVRRKLCWSHDPYFYACVEDYIAAAYPQFTGESHNIVDECREIAMTARLKNLLANHKKVLFIGGIAHWTRIAGMIANESIAPARRLAPAYAARMLQFQRVTVDPQLAAGFVDRIPALTFDYERLRLRTTVARPAPADITGRMLSLAQQSLIDAYRSHFDSRSGAVDSAGPGPGHESIRAFEMLLQNQRLLESRRIDSLHSIHNCAQSGVGKKFAASLAQSLMHHPWTGPDAFPDLPCLYYGGQSNDSTVTTAKYSADGRPFLVRSRLSAIDSGNVMSLEGCPASQRTRPPSFGQHHTWSAWDCLISGLSIAAMRLSCGKQRANEPAPFAGSLYEGVNIKNTIRAFSRGKDSIFVNEPRFGNPADEPRMIDAFPVVWIFETANTGDSRMIMLYENMAWMQPHAHDKTRFARILDERGSHMTAIVGYGRSLDIVPDPRISGYRFEGLVLYQPICWTNKQFARWAEYTEYRRNPFSSNTYDIEARAGEACGIDPGKLAWHSRLILAALPCSRESLVVVAPSNYRPDPAITAAARRLKKGLRLVSIDKFPRQKVSRVMLNYMAPSKEVEPRTTYPPWVSEVLGEHPEDNRELVPDAWFSFGLS